MYPIFPALVNEYSLWSIIKKHFKLSAKKLILANSCYRIKTHMQKSILINMKDTRASAASSQKLIIFTFETFPT